MSEWISVEDRLPEPKDYKFHKYKVKTIEFGINEKTKERILPGVKFRSGFKFITRDRQCVTHWLEE